MNVPAGPGGSQQGKELWVLTSSLRCGAQVPRCTATPAHLTGSQCAVLWVPGLAPQATDGHVACALVDLASVLTPEIMAPILANADVQERLLPYLPSGESLPQTADEIQNTLTSPQFQQVWYSLCTCVF